MEGSSSPPPVRANMLECFICMEPPTSPVSASCGHVFCWPCIYRWLENKPKPCPVCRHMLRRNIDIIPLYGAGSPGAGAGPGNGSGISTEVAVSEAVIPPRPRNPLLFTESFLRGLTEALDLEKDRVHFLGTVRINLELEIIRLLQRISHLTEQLQDRDRQLEQRNLVLAQEAHESPEREQ